MIVPWETLFKSSNTQAIQQEIAHTLYCFSFLYSLHLFSESAIKVFAGLQKLYQTYTLSIIGYTASLTMIIIATQHQLGLPALLISTMSGPLLTGLILISILYKKKLFAFNNIIKSTTQAYKSLLRTGGGFMIIQIGVMVGWGMDTLLISSTLGVAAVGVFAVTQRIYQTAAQPMAIINGPLWPAYADANARNKKKFIRKTLKKSIYYTLIYLIIVSIIISLNGQYLISLLTADTIQVENNLLFIYGIWIIIEGLGTALALFLNGCHIIRQQVFAVISLCLFSLPLKLYLSLIHI